MRRRFAMKKRIFLCIIAMFFANSVYAELPKEEPLYTQLNRVIIRLEHSETVQFEGTSKPIAKTRADGTAFFVAVNNELYIVTARHVVEKEYDLHARVQCRNEITGQIEVVLLELPRSEWVFPASTAEADTNYIDVAVMKLYGIKDRAVTYFIYAPSGSASADKNQLPEADPDPPRPVLVFGFPVDIGFELLEQKPLGRLGIISMKTDKKFLKVDGSKYAEERCFLIDCNIFPGNSGSPVMSQPGLDEDIELFGLVIASNTGFDFGVIEPVSRIREVIDIARKKSPAGNWQLY
jgi:V8-like Glu-specific endopeptidase